MTTRDDVQVLAVAEHDKDLLSGKYRATGNVAGQAQGLFDFTGVKGYTQAAELIDDPEYLRLRTHILYFLMETGRRAPVQNDVAASTGRGPTLTR